uniref:Golgin subfamily A conserved domain-containing protein n=1 Tax=Chlorocebus sabaeus TaxID=60711 RepID=A0A0D9R2X8_CHLSB
MWPQTRLPPHPAMAEETQQNKLAAAKKKLKGYWQRNSPGVPARAKRNRKTNGSVPETATSGGCHSPGDSPCQELPAALDSRSVKISQLKNTIKSLKQQKKQVEHQLEEEKKANNEKQKTERELEVQIQRLNIQKGKLSTDLYHTKRSLRYFEEESKDLADRLQCSSQRTGELEQVLSAVTATQKKVDRSSSHRKARMEWKLERSIREQAILKAQLTQLKESLKQAHLERDEYVQHLKGERARWQQRMRKMSQEVFTLKKEKKGDMRRLEKLERSFSKLKNRMAEPQHPEPPAVPSEVELQHLRKELERVSAELQAQVQNHQHVSLLNQTQKERLGRQEERLQQLPPQSGFKEVVHCPTWGACPLQNNKNKSALQLEQQVKERQEKVGEVKETVTSAPSKKGRKAGTNLWGGVPGQRQLQPGGSLSSTGHCSNGGWLPLLFHQSVAYSLNGEKRQSVATYQQQVAAYQQLTSEERLEAARQQKQQLQDQLSLMALPGEEEGGTVSSTELRSWKRPLEQLVPEDLESWEAMVSLTPPAPILPPSSVVPAPGTGDESVSGETHWILQEVMEKLSYTRTHLQLLRDLMRQWEEDIIRLAQDREEMKVKLLALQEMLLQLVYNKGHHKFLATAQNPADEPGPGTPAPQELGAADKHGDLCEMSLTDSVEPAQGEAKEGSPHDNHSAQPITQEHQEHPGL